LLQVLAASVAFAMRDRLALSFSLAVNMSVLQVSLYVTAAALLPFLRELQRSTQSVTRLHWLPAIRRPDTYRNWTSTSEQTMTFQDTPCAVGQFLS